MRRPTPTSPATASPGSCRRLFVIPLIAALCIVLLGLAASPSPAHAAENNGNSAKQEKAGEQSPTPPDDAPSGQTPKEARKLPFIEINREQGYVDLEGEVCLREGLLELAATIRGGKEHEAVFVIDARPRHLHFALLTLGLEPGHPGRWRYVNDEPMPIDPEGDPVRITVRYENDNGERTAHPVGHFIRNRDSGDPLGRTRFVFAGSRIKKDRDGKPVYRADSSGDVVSLVSFNDELLALPTAASNANEKLVWEANTPAIPPVGHSVVLRIRPAEPADDSDQPDKPAPDGNAQKDRTPRSED